MLVCSLNLLRWVNFDHPEDLMGINIHAGINEQVSTLGKSYCLPTITQTLENVQIWMGERVAQYGVHWCGLIPQRSSS